VFFVSAEKRFYGVKDPTQNCEIGRTKFEKKRTEVDEIVHRYTRYKIGEYVFRIFLETTGGWGTDPSKHLITKYQM